MVEAEGVRRAWPNSTRADRVLYILDAAPPAEDERSDLAAELSELPKGVPVTLIFNKIDLSGAQAHIDESRDPPQVFLSAKTGAGLSLLRAHLEEPRRLSQRRLGRVVGPAPPSRCAGSRAACVVQAAQNADRDAGVRTVRRGIAPRAIGLGRNHGRVQQR